MPATAPQEPPIATRRRGLFCQRPPGRTSAQDRVPCEPYASRGYSRAKCIASAPQPLSSAGACCAFT
eukprot:8021395-Alexandrium_andersonii.AAC.1